MSSRDDEEDTELSKALASASMSVRDRHLKIAAIEQHLIREKEALRSDQENLEKIRVQSWLKTRGFDPGGDLREPARSMRPRTQAVSTAMFEACALGDIGVCKYLFENGAAADIRTKNSQGWPPIVVACREGKLQAAQWLYEAGASADVDCRSANGFTALHAACLGGHLGVAKWLHGVEAVKWYVLYYYTLLPIQ